MLWSIITILPLLCFYDLRRQRSPKKSTNWNLCYLLWISLWLSGQNSSLFRSVSHLPVSNKAMYYNVSINSIVLREYFFFSERFKMEKGQTFVLRDGWWNGKFLKVSLQITATETQSYVLLSERCLCLVLLGECWELWNHSLKAPLKINKTI